MRIIDSADDMIFSNIPDSTFQTTYVGYMGSCKIMFKEKSLSSPIVLLATKAPAVNILRVPNLDKVNLYIPSE